jgi:hypothetical protein
VQSYDLAPAGAGCNNAVHRESRLIALMASISHGCELQIINPWQPE